MSSKVKPVVFGNDPKANDSVVKDVTRDAEVKNANNYQYVDKATEAIDDYVKHDKLPSVSSILSGLSPTRPKSDTAKTESGIDYASFAKAVEKTFDTPGAANKDMKELFMSNPSAFQMGAIALNPELNGSVVIGETSKLLKLMDDDKLTASSLVGVINNISGDSAFAEFIDLSTEMSFVNGICKIAIDLGIPDMVDKCIEWVDDIDRKNQLYIEQAINAGRTSDINSWKKFIEKGGKDEAYARREDLVRAVFQTYYRRPGENRSYAEIGNLIISTIESFWKNWDTDTSRSIKSVEWYSIASRDLSLCLSYTNRRPYAMAGTKLKKRSVDELMSIGFPKLNKVSLA